MNIPNHENYSSDVNMAFNVEALADISWLDDGGIPIVSFHCHKDLLLQLIQEMLLIQQPEIL